MQDVLGISLKQTLVIIPIWVLKKLRLREIKYPDQGHATVNW